MGGFFGGLQGLFFSGLLCGFWVMGRVVDEGLVVCGGEMDLVSYN